MGIGRRLAGALAYGGPGRTRLTLALAVGLAGAFALVYVLVFARGGESASAGLCAGSLSQDFACYERHLDDVLRTGGGEAALAELASLSSREPYVLSQCHVLAHSLGHEAFKVYKTVAAASAHGDGTCWSGYYHGVYESYMSQFDDPKLLALMPTICKRPKSNPYSFDYYNCLHGLGHGVTIRFQQDLFKALSFCDALDGDWEQRSCYSGAFMQNIVVDGRMHKSAALKPEDPVYPCNAVGERFKSSCWLMQTSYILRVLDYDYAKGFRICDGVESAYVSTCYRSMGRDISGNSHRDPGKVVDLCSLGRPALQGYCFAGAAKNAVFNDHGTPKADALCAIVPARYHGDCVQAREEAASTL